MKETKITKDDGLCGRTITVENYDVDRDPWGGTTGVYLAVVDGMDKGIKVNLSLAGGKAKDKLIDALLGENATVVTDLPEVKRDSDGWVYCKGNGKWDYNKPEKVLAEAKELLAIHAFLVKHNEEQEAAKKAEEEAVKAKEEANAKRRDELAKELGPSWATGFNDVTQSAQRAIDRIIELEEAAQVS